MYFSCFFLFPGITSVVSYISVPSCLSYVTFDLEFLLDCFFFNMDEITCLLGLYCGTFKQCFCFSLFMLFLILAL